jgi:hypothetical protein
MTPKQEERIRLKILKIKKALAADKRFWGGEYHDGRGYRYMPPELYLQIKDYKGALKYYNWFQKNFGDDMGFPFFFFEWTITLFKNNKIKDAEIKALKTFMSNTYLFDKYFEKDFLEIDKYESSNWELKELVEHFKYKKDSEELIDFTNWLEDFTKTERFYKVINEFMDLRQKAKTAPIGRKRTELFNRERKLLDNY